jgi:hypothetical protein
MYLGAQNPLSSYIYSIMNLKHNILIALVGKSEFFFSLVH